MASAVATMASTEAQSVTQPPRDEHAALQPRIEQARAEQARATADAVGAVPIESLGQGLDGVYDSLAHHLIPHAQAEDAGHNP
jgi:hypothetical protein